MKKRILAILILAACLTGCAPADRTPQEETQTMAKYLMISPEEAKEMMDERNDILILDVREEHEYKAGHVPGAKLLVLDSITEETAAAVIPTKDTTTLIYCRSGRRSKIAADKLADMGYTNLYEFGGILDWPYETE